MNRSILILLSSLISFNLSASKPDAIDFGASDFKLRAITSQVVRTEGVLDLDLINKGPILHTVSIQDGAQMMVLQLERSEIVEAMLSNLREKNESRNFTEAEIADIKKRYGEAFLANNPAHLDLFEIMKLGIAEKGLAYRGAVIFRKPSQEQNPVDAIPDKIQVIKMVVGSPREIRDDIIGISLVPTRDEKAFSCILELDSESFRVAESSLRLDMVLRTLVEGTKQNIATIFVHSDMAPISQFLQQNRQFSCWPNHGSLISGSSLKDAPPCVFPSCNLWRLNNSDYLRLMRYKLLPVRKESSPEEVNYGCGEI